jgi:hypothetical protein
MLHLAQCTLKDVFYNRVYDVLMVSGSSVLEARKRQAQAAAPPKRKSKKKRD